MQYPPTWQAELRHTAAPDGARGGDGRGQAVRRQRACYLRPSGAAAARAEREERLPHGGHAARRVQQGRAPGQPAWHFFSSTVLRPPRRISPSPIDLANVFRFTSTCVLDLRTGSKVDSPSRRPASVEGEKFLAGRPPPPPGARSTARPPPRRYRPPGCCASSSGRPRIGIDGAPLLQAVSR